MNPLGVPSRMNIGQILETHLGWAARALGMQIEAGAEGLADRFEKAGYDVEKYGMPETVEIDKFGEESIKAMKMSVPVFDGAHEEDMNATLDLAGVDPSGKTRLYDGRTGEPFDNKVTVGCVYMLKLHHLVDDKIMPVLPVRTLWLPNSLLVVKLSLAGNVLVRWRFGPWKLMVPLILCRKFSQSNLTTLWAV